MLFDTNTLDAIRRGDVGLAFRRWKTPRVRKGTQLRTRVGVVEVVAVDEVDPAAVGEDDIAAAGFADRTSWVEWVDDRPGALFRVELRWAGEDPRIALRERADLDPEEVVYLEKRLRRLDAAADTAWTQAVLRLIAESPGRVSTELAGELGLPRDILKRRVRRLKELGLTESLEVGYRISPRGRAWLDRAGPGP